MSKKQPPSHAEALKFHASVENRIRQKYGFAEKFKARWIANRKNMQISLLSAQMLPWEIEALEKYGIQPTIISHRELIIDVIKREFTQELVALYHSQVKLFYLFTPQFIGNTLFTFTFKTFEESIFKTVDQHQLPEEEKLVNIISKYIKKVNGIGPNKIQVAILNQKYLAVIGYKIFSDFQLNECKNCPAKLDTFKTLTNKLLFDAVNYACEVSGYKIYNTFSECDIEENLCVQLITLTNHTATELLKQF